MTSAHPEWRSMTFDGKILGIYRLPGGTWRYLREKGERLTFATTGEAERAARDKALDILFPKLRSTTPTDKEVADRLGVEDWLRTRREDVAAQRVIHKAGRPKVIVWNGRARA